MNQFKMVNYQRFNYNWFADDIELTELEGYKIKCDNLTNEIHKEHAIYRYQCAQEFGAGVVTSYLFGATSVLCYFRLIKFLKCFNWINVHFLSY